MPHFQNQREDAMAMSDQNAKLDRIIVLLEELIGHSRKAMDHAERQAQQEKEARADQDRRTADHKKADERAVQTPPRTPYPLGPAPESPSLFSATDPLSAQGRNETMASQSALEQTSQQENTFHRDVQAKD